MARTAFRTRVLVVFIALLVPATLVACGSKDKESDNASGSNGGSGSKGTLTVGSKLDPEAQLLANLMVGLLTDKGYTVKTKIPTGSTDITRKALENGDIDIYWEFTSTGLSILKQDPIGDPQKAYDKAKSLDAKTGISWLPSAKMNDTYALAVADGGSVKAKTLSDLATEGTDNLKLCVDPEGAFRKDVLPLVSQSYGVKFAANNTVQVNADLIPQAVKSGQCDIGIVYSTSFLIPKNKLRVVEDDKHAFGAYTPAPTIKTATLKKFPNLEDDMTALTNALSTDVITGLNAKAEGDAKNTKAVANEFLKGTHIVQG
jgi:osmoprotectant transport system substrate-binding protein